jgi:hypothetical protein
MLDNGEFTAFTCGPKLLRFLHNTSPGRTYTPSNTVLVNGKFYAMDWKSKGSHFV